MAPHRVDDLARLLRAPPSRGELKSPRIWLGQRGVLTTYGIRELLERRGRQAGIPDLHAHQFRHTLAYEWLRMGGNETDLMRIAAPGRRFRPTRAHLVRTRSQSLPPAALLPGVVKVAEMGTGRRLPDVGSIQAAWVPAAIVERFTEIVRRVGR
jgi:hypothetical protein